MRYEVQTLLEKVDIVDFISRYVKLKKTGRNFVGLCPFHKEKTPSFTVSPEKQLFYCFGCHTGGNVISFVMKYENLDFQDAVENIAREYGIPLKDWNKKTSSVYDALSELADFYHRTLKKSEFALIYLKQRGIELDLIDEFMLGFSDGNVKEFLSSTRTPRDVFFLTGILKISGSEVQDIFKGRVVIPIHDVNGRVIGFGGRAIEKDRLPKYINSPESPVFSKRSVLFGIEKAKKHIIEKNLAIIVEGYFDMISLYKLGVKNVVASLGTSITEEQIRRLKNYTENITLMLDSDEAGIKSALKAIDIFSFANVNGEIVLLPESEDPDSFARKGGYEAILSLIEKRMPILDYYFEFFRQKKGLETVQKKLAFIRSVMPYVERIRDSFHKNLCVRRISELTGIPEHIFWDEMKEKSQKIDMGSEKEERRSLQAVDRVLLGVVLNDPELAQVSGLKEILGHIKDGKVKGVMERFLEMGAGVDALQLNRFLSEIEDENLKESLICAIFETQTLDRDGRKKIIDDYLRHVRQIVMKEKLKELTERLAIAEKEKDEMRIAAILKEKKEVLKTLR